MMSSKLKPKKKHSCEDLHLFSSSPLSSQGQYKDDSTTLATIAPSAELKPNLGDKTAGSLDNLESEKQKQMLLNKIYQLKGCDIDGVVSLPQLIVCGDQSSGKSSVLAAIIGVPFPRNDNVCTRSRRPTEKLDQRFKLHGSKEFTFGRVFKVLWSEPAGTQGAYVEKRRSIHEGKKYSPIRRFVIFNTENRHCKCLTVSTYDGQGTRKHRVHSADHSIIYTSNRPSEQRSLLSKHIHKATLATTNKLNPISRLNYGKVYTVEHNVKVSYTGKLDEKAIDHDPDLNHGVYMNHEEPTRSDRESPITSNILIIGSRLHEDDILRTSSQPGDQDIAHDVAIEVTEGWKLVEENGELFLILDDETCDCDNRKYSHFQRLTRIATSPKALAGMGMSSGLLMGTSFLWLNKRMELNHASPIMGWVAETATINFSAATRDALGLIPDGVIFTVFVFATAILTVSSFAWMTNKTQNPGAKSLGWAVAAIISASWMFAAVTIEEFLLVCLPLSVGFGILSSCWFGHIDDEDPGLEKLVCEV